MSFSAPSSDGSPSVAPTFRNTPIRKLVTVLVTPLARLGLAGKRTHILTTVGRKSGRRYSTPVQLVFLDGERWLVAPYGERQWVKNARAAGTVELTRARHTERVRVEEVDAQTAAPVLRKYLRTTPVTTPFFTAKRSAPVEAFAAETDRHPVFRLVD
jgi:deazaflavin-dependent oxidoreductase (nitroreductase family)